MFPAVRFATPSPIDGTGTTTSCVSIVQRGNPKRRVTADRCVGSVRGHWAGEASNFVTEREHAADVVELLVRAAAAVLTERPGALGV